MAALRINIHAGLACAVVIVTAHVGCARDASTERTVQDTAVRTIDRERVPGRDRPTAASAPDTHPVAGVYVQRLSAADGTSHTVSLSLAPNGACRLNDAASGNVHRRAGRWTAAKDRVTCIFTEKDGAPFSDSLHLVHGGNTLVIDEKSTEWGSAGVGLALHKK